MQRNEKSRKIGQFVVLFLVLTVSTECFALFDGEIQGFVFDAITHRPIYMARIRTSDHRSAISETNGHYLIIHDEGTHTIKVEANGYGAFTDSVTVVKHETTHKDIYLQPLIKSETGDLYECDDRFDLANVIDINGDHQRHNFHDAGDADWAKFYGIPGMIYTISVSNPEILCNAVIELFDSDGHAMFDGPHNEQPPGVREFVDWRCPQEGVFFIKISNGEASVFGENTAYDLSLDHSGSCCLEIIQGHVLDAETHQPVASALIKTDFGMSAISHEDGSYKILQEPGRCVLTANAGGHETYTGYVDVKPSETTVRDILLIPGEKETHIIATLASPGGVIFPYGPVTVRSGSDITFYIIPDMGYRIRSISVDGIPIGIANSHTFANVTSDRTIAALFESDDLKNAITALKLLTGMEIGEMVLTVADINQDGKTGLAEVIFLLQRSSELRQ